MIKKFFKFSSINATFKKEIIGGITTFLSMIYILNINPTILHNAPSINNPSEHMPWGGLFLITAIVAMLSTLVMGLISNIPIALAPSMGLNGVFTYTVAIKNHLGYEGALIAVMMSSILLMIISVTPFRKTLINAIPRSLKITISASIGFFIAFIGFANIGIFNLSDKEGLPIVGLGSIKKNYPEILMGLTVLIIIFILYYKKISGAIAIAILFGLIISIIIGFTFGSDLVDSNGNQIFSQWSGWNYHELGSIKTIFNNTYSAFDNIAIWKNPSLYISALIFIIVSLFDATGTLVGLEINIQKHHPDFKISNKALVSDTLSILLSSTICSSPVSAYLESATGIEQGAKTGFSNIIIAILFFLSIPLFPIFLLVTPCISGAAVIFIGCLMFSSLKKIAWDKKEILIPSFFMILITLVTYSLVNGIALGLLFYVLMMLIEKKQKNIHYIIYLLDFIFIIYFVCLGFI